MKKLIELLNEYEEWKRVNDKNRTYIKQQYKEHMFKYNERLWNKIISKKFWFIKRLVDNDKIDFKLPIETLSFREYYDIKKSDFLIALLSISDTPIDDLISYLKIS